jgi:ATP-dependent Clp protease ATP-binding subunit ClpA
MVSPAASQRARNVVISAQNEAHAANNNEIRPEHLVLGLLTEPDALGAQAIIAQGVSLEAVQRTVTATLPPAAEQVPDLIPFDLGARKVLELTFREALRMGHNYIGTAHILLALLELEDGTGSLASLGVNKATTEGHIVAAWKHPSRPTNSHALEKIRPTPHHTTSQQRTSHARRPGLHSQSCGSGGTR